MLDRFEEKIAKLETDLTEIRNNLAEEARQIENKIERETTEFCIEKGLDVLDEQQKQEFLREYKDIKRELYREKLSKKIKKLELAEQETQKLKNRFLSKNQNTKAA